jgi:hypothetical protein
MLSQDQKFLFSFVVSAAECQPVNVQVRLFRGLAHCASDKNVAAEYRRKANNFEAQNRARQLELIPTEKL